MFRPKNNPATIILHHSAFDQSNFDKAVESIHQYHSKKWYSKLSKLGFYAEYHTIIGQEGEILYTRKLDETCYHSGNFILNIKSIAICLIGNFEKKYISGSQLESLKNVVLNLRYALGIKNIKGHREVRKTACPGVRIPTSTIYNLIVDNTAEARKGRMKEKRVKILKYFKDNK